MRVALLFILMFCQLASAYAAPVQATAFSVEGEAEYSLPDSPSFQILKTGQQLPVGSTIRTGDDGKVVLTTTPGTSVEISSDSILKITELTFANRHGDVTDRTVHLELSSGVVSVLADPSTPHVNDVKVLTPNGALLARGTFYTVIVRGGKTYASVGEGKIVALATQFRRH